MKTPWRLHPSSRGVFIHPAVWPLDTEVDLGPGHIVLDGVAALRERGTAAPYLFGPCLLCRRSPISATAELLYKQSLKDCTEDKPWVIIIVVVVVVVVVVTIIITINARILMILSRENSAGALYKIA